MRGSRKTSCDGPAVWPDWAIFWILDNFLKPLATINLPKSFPFLGNFSKGVKIIHFLVKPLLGNFYRHLAIFIWSHCGPANKKTLLVCITLYTPWGEMSFWLLVTDFFCLYLKYFLLSGNGEHVTRHGELRGPTGLLTINFDLLVRSVGTVAVVKAQPRKKVTNLVSAICIQWK